MQIQVDFDLSHWEDGAARFRAEWVEGAAPLFEEAVRMTYEISQELVHVITGNLKRSGGYDVREDSDSIEATLMYEAEYAHYEFRRGGTHDPITPAVVETEDMFWNAVFDPYREALEGWK